VTKCAATPDDHFQKLAGSFRQRVHALGFVGPGSSGAKMFRTPAAFEPVNATGCSNL